MNLRHNCTFQGCYMDKLPDWSVFNDCFPRGIRMGDVDGFVEVNRHFMFVENKRRGVSIPRGQLFALQRLADISGITVIGIRGDLTTDATVEVMNVGRKTGWQTRTIQQVQSSMIKWSQDAETRIWTMT